MSTTSVDERWHYASSGGLDYPVGEGQIWTVGASIRPGGFHVYACLDLMTGYGHSTVRRLLIQHQPNVLYCDPPWEQGGINSFRTKAGLGRASYTWLDLYSRIVSLVSASFPVWLEAGRRGGPKVVSEVLKDRRNPTVFDVTYYRRKPSLVLYSGAMPAPIDLTGMDDEDTPRAVMESYPQGLVFDPCAGRGGTAAAAAKLSWNSLSIELSPFRMSAGLHALAEVTHAEPQQIV